MKVLFIALGIYGRTGGIERFNQRVVCCLSELHGTLIDESVVIALWDTPEQCSQVPGNIRFIPGCSQKIQTMAHFLRHVWQMQPDIILYGHILLAPLALLARLLCRTAHHALFIYGFEVWGDLLRPVPRWEPWLVHTALDRIITVSRFTGDRMRQAYRLPRSIFYLLPCAVDWPAHGFDISLPPRAGLQTLLSVTRLGYTERYKHCDKVILAMPHVLKVFPNVHYYIAGEGPLRSGLAALAKEVGVADHVHLLGYVSDARLNELYRQADIFVLPSTKEGFGIVFLEAWLHQLPVIASTHGASAEVVTHEVNGLLVDPEPGQIAEAVLRLLKDPDLARRLGQAGFETVRRHYTHEHFRQQFAQILIESRR